MAYSLQDFSFDLPAELIAQKPIKPRDRARLMVLDKKTGLITHRHFYDLIDYLRPGDLLVLNDSKVFPARLIGKKAATGGRVEIFLHRSLRGLVWECLVGGRIKPGDVISLESGLSAVMIKDNLDGTWRVKFNKSGERFWAAVNRSGLVPLPPYIKRAIKSASDRADYQTVFANPNKTGSVAAPTAGRHFTKNLLNRIRRKGVEVVFVTLHVGLGTFAPVKLESIKGHKMHKELVEVSALAARLIARAKKNGRRIVAVGTTSARVLESLDIKREKRQVFWTDIFIYPGYNFKAVDALVTNFHLPRSTLLMLVSALAGKDQLDLAYREAVKSRYRFFSYGDAMFIS